MKGFFFQKKHIIFVEVAKRGVKFNPADWKLAGTLKPGFAKKKRGPKKGNLVKKRRKNKR